MEGTASNGRNSIEWKEQHQMKGTASNGRNNIEWKEQHRMEKTASNGRNSIEWKEQRCGHITAGNSKSVHTRSKTLKQQPRADASALVKVLMGYKTKRVSLMLPNMVLQWSSMLKCYIFLIHEKHIRIVWHVKLDYIFTLSMDIW